MTSSTDQTVRADAQTGFALSTLSLGASRTVLELKAFFRERDAVIFSFLFPFIMLGIFSVVIQLDTVVSAGLCYGSRIGQCRRRRAPGGGLASTGYHDTGTRGGTRHCRTTRTDKGGTLPCRRNGASRFGPVHTSRRGRRVE
jgi:hypothetical protein